MLRIDTEQHGRLALRRDHAQRLHQTQKVGVNPGLFELVSTNTENVCAGDGYRLARCWKALEWPLMGPAGAPAHSDSIALSHQVEGGIVQVGKSGVKHPRHLHDACRAMYSLWESRMMSDKSGRNNLSGGALVDPIEDLFKEATD